MEFIKEFHVLFQYLILAIAQFSLVGLKVVNTDNIINGSLLANIVTSSLLQSFWLISSAIGISSLIEGRWDLVVIHVISGTLGNIVAIKFNRRKKNKIC